MIDMDRRTLLQGFAVGIISTIAGCSEMFEPDPDEAPNEPEKLLLQSWEVGPSDEVSGGTDKRLVSQLELQNTESEYTVAAEVRVEVDIQDGNEYSAETEEAIESASTSTRTIELADYDEFDEDEYNGMMGGYLNYNVKLYIGNERKVNKQIIGETVGTGS